MNARRPVIGLTMGDPAGIGPEIIVRTLEEPSVQEACRPVVIGDVATMEKTVRAMGRPLRVHRLDDPSQSSDDSGVVEVYQATTDDLSGVEYGKVQAAAGKAAAQSVVAAVNLALDGKIAAMATAPLNKDAMNQAGYHYPGHTEMLADLTHTQDYSLTLLAGNLRVIHVTTHVSMRHALELLSKDRVLRIIRLADRFCRQLGISEPRIAVCGFNCHAGENGLFGTEDIEHITPAVAQAQGEGIEASGPYPGDTIFYRCQHGQFDMVVAMYHDQGHIPVKMLGFEGGVNTTAGLPIIRTSVDHGTAFGRAGQWRAEHGSMTESTILAATLARQKQAATPVGASSAS